MYLSLRFRILSFFIFSLPALAFSQEQVTQIEGPDCCYHIVDIKEMDDRIFVLATDYRGAVRLYEQINGNYTLYMENIPDEQRRVANQGFGIDGDYYFVLYQKEVHYYYPLTDEWKSYDLPDHGVYSKLPDWYTCHSTLRVSESGVIDWVSNEGITSEVDLVFHDIHNNEEVPLFEGKFFSQHCPEIYQIDDYILGRTRSDSNTLQVISYHIPTKTEQVILESSNFIDIQKISGRFAIISGLQSFITTGNPDSTFELQHTVNEASFVNVQRLNNRWELIFSFDTEEIYTRQYSLKGDFIRDEWINYTTPILSDLFRVCNIERTAYDKYIITFWANSIYVLDLSTQKLTPIDNTETYYFPKDYFLIGPQLITFHDKNYYDQQIQTYNLNTSRYETHSMPEVVQLNQKKLINDKLYIIANNIFGDLLIDDEIIDYMGTMFSFQPDSGWREDLKLSENNYGLLYGRLEETDNGYFLLGSGQIFKYKNGSFDKIFESGQIMDWMSVVSGQYFISTDTPYQQNVQEIELHHISPSGDIQLLGEFQEFASLINRYDYKFIPTGYESGQILIENTFGNVSYFDLTDQKIVELRSPSNKSINYLEVADNMLIGNTENSYWQYNPLTTEFTHLFDINHSGSIHYREFYATDLYYLNFYFFEDNLTLYSTNRFNKTTEKILEVHGFDGNGATLDVLTRCNQSVIFSLGWENPLVFVTDGTQAGSKQINQWQEIESIAPASNYDVPYVNVQSESSGLYHWNCSRDTFELAHDSIITLQYPFTFEGEQWIVGRDNKGLTATIENDHSIRVHDRLQTKTGHSRKATRLYDVYSDGYVKQTSSTQAFFRGNFNGDGPELWTFQSDSTLYQIADINPGPFGSNPYDLTIIEDHLYYLAYTYDAGMQVWRLHLDSMGTTATEEQLQKVEYIAAPNPTRDQLHLSSLPKAYCDIILMDLSGKILEQFRKPEGATHQSLQLKKYPPGLYFLTIKEEKGNSRSIKIIKL